MRTALLLFIMLNFLTVSAQDILKFTVDAGTSDRMDCPVSLSLDRLNYNTDQTQLALFERSGGKETEIPCQVEPGHTTTLWFILSGKTAKGKKRDFVLRRTNAPSSIGKITLQKAVQDLNFQKDKKPILSYRYGVTFPPEGVSPLYQRSGFIHPLYSPGGEMLTRIQAPDHYHHYGIWGPWTDTKINNRPVDFWNLMKGEGTVRFAGFLSETEGSVFSGFKALQQHVDFGAKGKNQIALNEILDVRTWNIQDKTWLVDYTTSLNCPLDSGILFVAYRYGGGIGFRATEKWHKDNCTVLTSEGKTRVDADGSNARWCIVEGESATSERRSGILFMSHPANRMHPEPMRVWPLDGNNGRGDMFFEFCPIRHQDWKIEKGNDYTLKYRMLVFDGKVTPDQAEMYWQAFANPPKITIEN